MEHLRRLTSNWDVDKTIALEEKKLVIIRFGTDWDHQCMQVDDMLAKVEYDLSNFADIYLVDITEVTGFNELYELHDPCTIMFFFRNKHIKVDFGTGNNNKINWVINNKQDFIDVVEEIYRGVAKGKNLIISPINFGKKITSFN